MVNIKSRAQVAHRFSKVPVIKNQRSVFQRNSSYKTTCDAGYLVPIYVDEMVPADTFHGRVSMFSRIATPIFPIMDNVYCDVFFFVCPNRLLWSNWERFMGARDNPTDSIDYEIPTVTPTGSASSNVNTLVDYFGLPISYSAAKPFPVNALPFRMYNKVYNDWFRDQNLQDSLVSNVSDTDDVTNYSLVRRGKRHDYFTSCLPFVQKGDPVVVPIGNEADIIYDANSGTAANLQFSNDTAGTRVQFKFNAEAEPDGIQYGNIAAYGDGVNLLNAHVADSTSSFLKADLASASAVTVNQLRQAFQVQRILEKDARSGTRYTELIEAHFGVVSPDSRLQRSEYVGGGTVPVNINPIATTADISSGENHTNVGDLGAMGTAAHHDVQFSCSALEHQYLMGFMCFRADYHYQNCVNRMWSRQTRFDFYDPTLAHLGEQAVLNKEIYYDDSVNESNDDVFGYQERWGDYRYKPSQITGLFRSQAPQSLDAWHLAQDFTSLPSLNSDFIVENPPMSRVIAVQSEPDFIVDIAFNVKCARNMPLYSVPGLIDHF